MVQNKFEGDINTISEPQREFIDNVLVEMGFKNSKVSFQAVGKAGDNYVASVKRIVVEGEQESFTMIAKVAPVFDNPQLSENTSILFMNEHIIYTEVLPKLIQLQKDAGIPEKEQLRYAKCYGSFPEPSKEVLLLEDLKPSNFIMLNKFEPLSNECVKSVLKNFALLHSLSFVLKQKEPEAFKKSTAGLKNVWLAMSDDKNMSMFFKSLDDDTIAVVEEPEHKDFVRHKISNDVPMLAKLISAKQDNKYNAVQQGDPWTNNIMFKFEDDKLINSVMIDYQLASTTSPVCDILYMILSCTDYDTRKQHYYDWINYYYSELDKSLSNFNLEASIVYPRDILDVDMKEYGKYYFGVAAFLISMMVKKSNDAEKMQESIKAGYDNDSTEMVQAMGVSSLDEESKMLYRNRIVGVINSLTEFGLL